MKRKTKQNLLILLITMIMTAKSSGNTFLEIVFREYDKSDWRDKKIITLTGSIVKKSFYGPPNFGETPNNDNIEIYFFLLPDTPILYDDEGKHICLKEIQLVFTAVYRKNFDAGKNYTVSGKMQKATTGHHHTDFILIVEDVYEGAILINYGR
ncbi:hypothetical protein [Treponema sp. Marseille-Q4132]|uniref:hypothetical protein n=1 Tax=Treponema sp. Marseille-Q4132 TaxID=2766701 RepID=UPI001652C35A|nr:hypothetical protein [Treponema sp. Marseille-Q4132]QNL96224.1 hypothetical protein H9I35_07165 [Treponema sp. Marseille-Q4132]